MVIMRGRGFGRYSLFGWGRQGLREGSWRCTRVVDVHASRGGVVEDHSASFFFFFLWEGLLGLCNGMECEGWDQAFRFRFTSVLWRWVGMMLVP